MDLDNPQFIDWQEKNWSKLSGAFAECKFKDPDDEDRYIESNLQYFNEWCYEGYEDLLSEGDLTYNP